MTTEITESLVCKGMLVCEQTVVDDETKLLSLERVVPQLFITVPSEQRDLVGQEARNTDGVLELVVLWERVGDKEEVIQMPFKVEFVGPDGELLIRDMYDAVEVPAQAQSYFSIIKLANGLLIKRPGAHTFRIIGKGSGETESYVMHEMKFVVRMHDEHGDEVTL